MNEQYAVRWAIRPLKRMWSICWTKWHWTLNGDFTLCGRPIVIGREDVPMLPECDDRQERIDCVVCKKRLARRSAKLVSDEW